MSEGMPDVDHDVIEAEADVILKELVKLAPEKLTKNEMYILGLVAGTLAGLRAILPTEDKT